MISKNETDNKKEVCVNCQYMQRLLGRNPNDDFPCNFWHKMIKNVQEYSCPNWKKRELDSLI